MTSMQAAESVQEKASPLSPAAANPMADRIAAAMSKAGLGIRERDNALDLGKMDEPAKDWLLNH
jgi:hypothetical protein